jgi:streptogramin lyase
MRKGIAPALPAMTLAIVLLTLASCNNQAIDISFPANDSAYPQPVSQPIKLGNPRKLNWVTTKSGGLKPEIKKLDINELPATGFDTIGFRPIHKPFQETRFAFNSLPSQPFNLEKIPSNPLKFRKSILSLPVLVKAGRIIPKTGSSITVSDIGLAQGLPEKIVLCILKTKNGSVWIGTNKGLYRYDGDCMQVYGSIAEGIADLIEDRDGRIWFINNRGFGMIDSHQGTFIETNEIHTVFPALPRMILDAKGLIWISRIANQGVDVIDPQNLTYKHLDGRAGLSGSDTWAVFEDEKKNIWLSTNDGADIIPATRDKIIQLKKTNGLGNDTLRAITGDMHGRVWIAFKHGAVSGVDIEKGIISTYGIAQGIDNFVTYKLLFDNKGMIWMATDKGLSILDPEKGLSKFFKDEEGIPEDFVLDLFQDDLNRVWAATYSGGLNIIEGHGEMVHPVGTKSMSTLLEDAAGRIWVGAANADDGIHIMDYEKKLSRQLNKKHGLPDNFIQNLMEVDD